MGIDYSEFAFPKTARKRKPSIQVRRDGRELCSKKEYKARLALAWAKQKGRCYLCGKPVTLEAATLDHVNPRGMGGGKRDDRPENIRAACWKCNGEKGSKRLA